MQADQKKINRKINIVRGQLEGITKMINEDAYCLDISNQILATIALLKSANHDIISAHLKHCIVSANSDELATKLIEIDTVLKRIV